jgi:hypothetical protein
MSVVFKNKGEIDPRAFSSFGVNAKPETDSPIGFFGTGLKYALSVLLRNDQRITVYSGQRVIEFSLVVGVFRDKEFQFINMSIDGSAPVELGFTTELGKNWEMWMAYRELACNCMDEGGEIFAVAGDPWEMGKPEETVVVVSGAEFLHEYQNRDKIILTGDPIFATSSIEIHQFTSNKGYYRNVRVHEDKPGLYTYNIIESASLTEDRTLASQGDIRHIAAREIILRLDDAKIMEKILLADNEYLEADFDFHGWGWNPSNIFLQTVARLVEDKFTTINQSAVRVFKEATKKTVSPKEFNLNKVQQGSLTKAIVFCESFGFNVSNYEMVFIESLGEGTLGVAMDGKIFIAERVFHQGTKQIASTLIEEYLHLKFGFKDLSRELQTYLFDRIVSMGEELRGEGL